MGDSIFFHSQIITQEVVESVDLSKRAVIFSLFHVYFVLHVYAKLFQNKGTAGRTAGR